MEENTYNMTVMQGNTLTRKFTLQGEDFKFTDYDIVMEIRDSLNDESIIYIEDEDFNKTDTTLEFIVNASVTKTFPLYGLIYGIELIDKNNSENVSKFLTGNIVVEPEIPRDEVS